MSDLLDVVVIGGGVVGCSTLFQLTNGGYKCLLVEKNKSVLCEVSSGNSGMLHTGFDAPDNSLELHCIKKCQSEIFSLLDKWCLPHKQIGAVMVAWNNEQKVKLCNMYESSHKKGIDDMYKLSISDLYSKESNLNTGAVDGLWIPRETVIDPWLFPVSLLEHSVNRNSKVLTECEVIGFTNFNNYSVVQTSHGPITCKTVVNCSGIYGDVVDKIAGCSTFSIQPRKGQYAVYDKSVSHLINSSILPVPTDKTKGVIVFKTVYDNIIVGPTAEDVTSRRIPPAIDIDIRRRLYNCSKSTVPKLATYNYIGEYTGLRSATQYSDYQIRSFIDRKWISVGGIRSTGLSGCLGIASLVQDEVCQGLGIEPTYEPMSSIDTLDWSFTGHNTVKFAEKQEYPFTHPITKYGQRHQSRL